MTTMIFVHGISIRAEGYRAALGQIEKALSKRPDVTLAPCLWAPNTAQS